MKGMENTGQAMASHGANTEATSAMEAGNVRTLAGTLMRELAPSELDWWRVVYLRLLVLPNIEVGVT